MLRSLRDIYGYTLHTEDGDFGEVRDILFDDRDWTVRYLVVDTRKILPGRKVVVPPSEAGQPDWSKRRIPINMTTEKIKNGPTIEEHAPLSRKHEEDLHNYFEWQPYWLGSNPPRGTIKPGQERIGEERDPDITEPDDAAETHLRSADVVMSYSVDSRDGTIGDAIDMIFDDTRWIIRYFAVGAESVLPGRKVLLATEWITKIEYEREKIFADVTRENVENSPEYDPAQPVNRKYEEVLYDFYGRPRYWAE